MDEKCFDIAVHQALIIGAHAFFSKAGWRKHHIPVHASKNDGKHCPDSRFTVLAGHVATGKMSATQGEEETGKRLIVLDIVSSG
jgi:hypothetical protein